CVPHPALIVIPRDDRARSAPVPVAPVGRMRRGQLPNYCTVRPRRPAQQKMLGAPGKALPGCPIVQYAMTRLLPTEREHDLHGSVEAGGPPGGLGPGLLVRGDADP